MSDTTVGFKVNSEIKEKVHKMVEASGLSNKEWFESLVQLYELQRHKENDGIRKYLSDVNALEEHTKRINEIFSSLLKKILDEHQDNLKNMNDLRTENEDRLQQLHSQHAELQGNNRYLSEQLTQSHSDLEAALKQLHQLEELNSANKIIISDQMTENQRLQTQLKEFTSESVKQLEEQYRTLKSEFELQKIFHEKELLQLQAAHQKELLDLFPKKAKKLRNTEEEPEPSKKRGRPKKQLTGPEEVELTDGDFFQNAEEQSIPEEMSTED